MTAPRPDDLLTVGEVADLLDVRATDHVRKLIHAGTLPATRDETDRNYRIRRDHAEAYRDGRLRTAPSPMFAELGAFDDRIKELDAARSRIVEQRNRAMVRWSNAGESTIAIAEAARLGRQHATTVLRITKAELEAEAARHARR